MFLRFRFYATLMGSLVSMSVSSVAAPTGAGPEVLPPAVSQAIEHDTPVDPALVTADNGLGFALANQLRGARPGANQILSPLSIALALDMSYSGAAGATRQAMAGALALGPGALAEPEQANAALQAKLIPADPDVQLKVANSIWTRQGVALPSFLELNRTFYGAYVGDLAGGAAAVNAWAAEATQGQITDLLPPGDVERGSDLLLVNTVCFHGNWTVPFVPGLTAPGRFTRWDGSQVDCQMMRRTGIMRYAETDQYQAAWLPYGRDRFGMVLLLPAPGVALDGLAANMDPARFQTLVKSLDGAAVALAMPKFSCATSAELKQPLTALGMGPAFDPVLADFSRMATLPQVMLAVVHKARIAVDERGTLAAAGTGVVAGATAAPGQPRTMALDRPFLLAITDLETGAVLFLGEMGDPTAS